MSKTITKSAAKKSAPAKVAPKSKNPAKVAPVVAVFAAILTDALAGMFGPVVAGFYVTGIRNAKKTDFVAVLSRDTSACPKDPDEVRAKLKTAQERGRMFENAEAWQRAFFGQACKELGKEKLRAMTGAATK